MNVEYDNELNKRIYSRISPSQHLPPLFDVRPLSTKYTFFQTIEERPYSDIHLLKYNYITPENTFIPGSRAPIDYFINNVDIESKLRNQFMSLQKSSQSVYVPELNSSLYENSQAYKKNEYATTTCKTSELNKNLAPDTFYNFTRNNFRK
jgi:hypothetical protein